MLALRVWGGLVLLPSHLFMPRLVFVGVGRIQSFQVGVVSVYVYCLYSFHMEILEIFGLSI
jgi:hypothetical protein